jgi:hypothetical protein
MDHRPPGHPEPMGAPPALNVVPQASQCTPRPGSIPGNLPQRNVTIDTVDNPNPNTVADTNVSPAIINAYRPYFGTAALSTQAAQSMQLFTDLMYNHCPNTLNVRAVTRAQHFVKGFAATLCYFIIADGFDVAIIGTNQTCYSFLGTAEYTHGRQLWRLIIGAFPQITRDHHGPFQLTERDVFDLNLRSFWDGIVARVNEYGIYSMEGLRMNNGRVNRYRKMQGLYFPLFIASAKISRRFLANNVRPERRYITPRQEYKLTRTDVLYHNNLNNDQNILAFPVHLIGIPDLGAAAPPAGHPAPGPPPGMAPAGHAAVAPGHHAPGAGAVAAMAPPAGHHAPGGAPPAMVPGPPPGMAPAGHPAPGGPPPAIVPGHPGPAAGAAATAAPPAMVPGHHAPAGGETVPAPGAGTAAAGAAPPAGYHANPIDGLFGAATSLFQALADNARGTTMHPQPTQPPPGLQPTQLFQQPQPSFIPNLMSPVGPQQVYQQPQPPFVPNLMSPVGPQQVLQVHQPVAQTNGNLYNPNLVSPNYNNMPSPPVHGTLQQQWMNPNGNLTRVPQQQYAIQPQFQSRQMPETHEEVLIQQADGSFKRARYT